MAMLQIDNLASLARTALTDPHGLPAGDADSDSVGYAVARLDEIINLLNPAELDRETFAKALRGLVLQMVALMDNVVPYDGKEWCSEGVLDDLGEALDAIDRAINSLEEEAEEEKVPMGTIAYDAEVGHVCSCAVVFPAVPDLDEPFANWPSSPAYLLTVDVDRSVPPTESGSWLYFCKRCGATAWSGC